VTTDGTRTRVPHYVMISDPAKGWLTSSLWGKEFPLPPKPGAEWDQSPDLYKVEELKAGIQVPAGFFTDCLKVVRFAAGGDAGTETRYYAPDVGLVYALFDRRERPVRAGAAARSVGRRYSAATEASGRKLAQLLDAAAGGPALPHVGGHLR